MLFISLSAAVVAGQETELLVGIKNEGNILFFSVILVASFMRLKFLYSFVRTPTRF